MRTIIFLSALIICRAINPEYVHGVGSGFMYIFAITILMDFYIEVVRHTKTKQNGR